MEEQKHHLLPQRARHFMVRASYNRTTMMNGEWPDLSGHMGQETEGGQAVGKEEELEVEDVWVADVGVKVEGSDTEIV